MKATPLPLRRPHAGPLLLATGCLLATACSDPEPPAAGDPPKAMTATERTIEELFGPAGVEEEVQPDLPQLAFRVIDGGLPDQGTWREHPLLADFTGDGRDDLVASNREEDGLNAWATPATEEGQFSLRIEGFPRDLMYGGCDAGDLDGDGDLDLVFGAHSEGLRVFLNDGAMAWTPGEPQENPFLMLDVALGDVDGDGHLDVVGIGHFNGGVGVYLGDGKAGFRRLPQSSQALPGGAFGTQVELADIDGDGLDDLALCTDKGARVLYTRKDESGELSWEDGSAGLPAPKIGNALRGLIPADFDGDGRLELAFGALADPSVPEPERDDVGVLRRGEDGTWTRMDSGLPRGPAFQDVLAADFDKDGHLDLALLVRPGGALIFLGDGTGAFELRGALPDTFQAARIAQGDANGDGWIDLVVQNTDSKSHPDGGGLRVFINGPAVWGED